MRAKKKGTVPTKVEMGRRVCSMDDCDVVHYGNGYCNMHYARNWRHGDPDTCLRVNGPVVGYHQAHVRVGYVYGPAVTHACVSCGNGAAHWAYKHNAVEELEEVTDKGSVFKYSLDIEDYQAMCRSCHTKFDYNRLKDRVSV